MIYCVEDDRSIRELVVYSLNNSGFKSLGLESGEALYGALKNASAGEEPELILLDIMLSGQDGIQILKKLKSESATKKVPVIMLTAKGSEYDKVIGLDSGADDYITKPFGIMELISRIKAVLRRYEGTEKQDILTAGAVKIDTKGHVATVNGSVCELTFKEFELLSLLMRNSGIVLTRERLLESIWGYDFDGETRTVDVHIRTLRAKLGEAGEVIETVRGVGYRISAR